MVSRNSLYATILLVVIGGTVRGDVPAESGDLAVGTCSGINVPLCVDLKYNSTRFPNILDQQSQEAAGLQVHQFYPLVKVVCSPYLKTFLCAVFVPRCVENQSTLPPCYDFCEKAKDGCEILMNRFGFQWPDYLNCDKFPRRLDNNSSVANCYDDSPDAPSHITLSALEPWGATVEVKESMSYETIQEITGYVIRIFGKNRELEFEMGNTFHMSGLFPNEKYSVQIAGKNSYGLGWFSERYHFTTPLPERSGAPTITSSDHENTDMSSTFIVSWTPPKTTQQPILKYSLRIRKVGGDWSEVVVVSPNTRTYEYKGLEEDTEYDIEIWSSDEFQDGRSSTISFTTKANENAENDVSKGKNLNSTSSEVKVVFKLPYFVSGEYTCYAEDESNSLKFKVPETGEQEGSCKKEILPRRYDISDTGHRAMFHGWADVQGQGATNDYCRFVQGKHGRLYLTCALAGTEGDNEYNYSTKDDVRFDPGHYQTWYMKDENGDGRDDYCRCVGDKPNTYVSCVEASTDGFVTNVDKEFRPSYSPSPCHDTLVNPCIGYVIHPDESATP
uniref:Uncharacterized protein LOC100369768 n=1 Tax=Saccoglossus kowalevskii TaxID=10224 RepID=A0ABM0GQC1_SACKO|nr:PREDICTED: uncharacterized protein LOC100369768 [Saccoglossus kowalevskii]